MLRINRETEQELLLPPREWDPGWCPPNLLTGETTPDLFIAHNEIKGRSKWGSYYASCVVKRKENSSVGYYLRAFRLRVDPRYGKDRTIPASLSSYSPIPWISSNIKTGGGELKSMRLPTPYWPSNRLSGQDKSKWTPSCLFLLLAYRRWAWTRPVLNAIYWCFRHRKSRRLIQHSLASISVP